MYLEDLTAKSSGRVFGAALQWAVQMESDSHNQYSSDSIVRQEALGLFGGLPGAVDFLKHFSVEHLKKKVGRVKKLRGLPEDWLVQIVKCTETEKPIEHAAVIALIRDCPLAPRLLS